MRHQATGREQLVLRGHAGEVACVAFAAGGHLASGGLDGPGGIDAIEYETGRQVAGIPPREFRQLLGARIELASFKPR